MRRRKNKMRKCKRKVRKGCCNHLGVWLTLHVRRVTSEYWVVSRKLSHLTPSQDNTFRITPSQDNTSYKEKRKITPPLCMEISLSVFIFGVLTLTITQVFEDL